MAAVGVGSFGAGHLSGSEPPSGTQSPQGQLTIDEIRTRLKPNVPTIVAAVLHRTLSDKPQSLDTDWNGTFRIEGLLRWSKRGVPEALDFARSWFEYHLEHDRKLTDEEFLKSYGGARSRVIRSGLLPFTTYAGFFGLAFACHKLYQHTLDPRARQVCLDVAEAVLHVSPRDSHGLVAHDDVRFAEFAIPDVAFFAVRALMIASLLDEKVGIVYRRQALYQIRAYTDAFLDRKTGLVRTALYPSGLGPTCWCRASGWLMWALTAALRHLPREHEAFSEIASDLAILADGVAKAQGPNGGLRVLVDNDSTPEETSGTGMCVAGIHEAVRKGWIVDRYRSFIRKGWQFVEGNVTPDGWVRKVYTGWAVPAEERKMSIDDNYHGWIPGFFLVTADEMYAS